MEETFERLEKMNTEERECIIFLTLKKIEDSEKRFKMYNTFKEKGYKEASKTYILATICTSNKKDEILLEKIDEYNIVHNNYKNILQKTKQLANELNLTDSLEIANLYTYLLWNGYFSKNKELYYQMDKRINLSNNYSFDIMNSRGVCLNFSSMLTDLINEFDYNAASIMNKFEVKTRKYTPNINRKITKPSVSKKLLMHILGPISNKIGNHAFTLIEENGQMYIYDPTNLLVLNINDKFKCTDICGNESAIIKPYLSYFLNKNEKSEMALDKLNIFQAFVPAFNEMNYIKTWENNLVCFNDNINLLNDFHKEINENIEIISDKSKNIKKLLKEARKN